MAQPIDSIENANWWNTMHGFFDLLEGLPGPKLLYWSLAAIALLYFLILFLRRQPKNVVAYCTENGSVTVSRSAIIELVQTSCEQIQDISKPQVKIKSEGETSHFEVSIKLKSGGSLRTIEQTLQSHLRQALTENLGIENLGQINIVATGFKSSRIDSTISSKASYLSPIEMGEDTEDKEEGFFH